MDKKIEVIVDAIEKTRGEDILVYDFTAVHPFIDRVVITHADNMRQVYAIANNVKDALKENNYELHHFEGNSNSRWILIDAHDVIVHVFLDEEREL